MEMWELAEFIYLNSNLSREEAKEIAVYSINHDLNKFEALEIARGK